MGSSVLPLEGLTLETMVRPIRAILLQPILTAGLLVGSFKDPFTSQRILTDLAKDKVKLSTLRRVLSALLAAGILYRLNNLLTKRVLNNWTSDKSWDWQREIVLVTGGCSGIGELIVRRLVECNVKVVVFDVSDPAVKIDSGARYYKVDITSSAAIKEAAQKVREEVGDPTVLVNNAGIGTTKTILDAPEDLIRATFNVNVVAHFLMIKEFLPYMVQRNHGHIVTVASMASFMVHAGNVAYASTKSAVLALHEGLGQELKSRYAAEKVRTTVVHPSWVRTPLIESTLLRRKDFNEFVLEPATVANAVVSQIFRAQGAQLILPGRLGVFSSLRGWPSWLQESLRNSVANTL